MISVKIKDGSGDWLICQVGRKHEKLVKEAHEAGTIVDFENLKTKKPFRGLVRAYRQLIIGGRRQPLEITVALTKLVSIKIKQPKKGKKK